MSTPDRAHDPNRKANAVRYKTDYDKLTGTIMGKDELQARDGWVSPWPQGHPNYTEYQSPEQQKKNLEPETPYTPEYKTDYDEETDSIMSKSDLQARDGWVSPWPQGHPNYTKAVK